MWVFLSDSFLSIVADKGNADRLLVRGRHPDDIKNAFPDAQVEEWAGTDYRFRTFLPREQVAKFLSDQARGIEYTNFKGSVKDEQRHHAYLNVWRNMRELQRRFFPKDQEPKKGRMYFGRPI
jgi:hypothetical protein